MSNIASIIAYKIAKKIQMLTDVISITAKLYTSFIDENLSLVHPIMA